MPPNSFAEWVIGQNLPKRSRKPDPQPRTESLKYKVELFTDDEGDTEKVALTFPRPGSASKAATPAPPAPSAPPEAQPDSPATKKVSFTSPPKPVLKKSVTISATEVTSSASSASDTDAETSSAVDTDDPSGDEIRRQLAKLRAKRRARRHQREASSTSDNSEDSSSCDCSDCENKERQLELAWRESRLRKKLRRLRSQSQSESSAQSDQTSEDESLLKKHHPKLRRKGSGSPTSESETSGDSYTDTDSESYRKWRKALSRRLQRRKERREKKTEAQESKDESKTKDGGDANAKKEVGSTEPPVEAKSFEQNPVPHPDLVRPNLLMPIQAQVLKIEHAVEEPEDPRPNSFYDVDSATVRVYHGPVYGNPSGTMYPIRNKQKRPALPVGVPHPLYNPYYEASRMGHSWPSSPSNPYWGAFPPPMAGGGLSALPYYYPAGAEPSSRNISSSNTRMTDANAGPSMHKRRPPNRRQPAHPRSPSRPTHGNHHIGHHSGHHNGHHNSHHHNPPPPQQTKDDNDGLNSNNSAANIFNDDSGEGWGRGAWDNPDTGQNQGNRNNNGKNEPDTGWFTWENNGGGSTGGNNRDVWKFGSNNKNNNDNSDGNNNNNWGGDNNDNTNYWENGSNNNNSNDNNWGGGKNDDAWGNGKNKDVWGGDSWNNENGSQQGGNNGSNGGNDAWGDWGGNDQGQCNWDDNRSNGMGSSSGHGNYPQDSNVGPSKHSRGEQRRGQGIFPTTFMSGLYNLFRTPSGNGKLPAQPYPASEVELERHTDISAAPYNSSTHQRMPGAWEDPANGMWETGSQQHRQQQWSHSQRRWRERRHNNDGWSHHGSRDQNNYSWGNHNRDGEFVPLWGDPTAAQSSHDPPAWGSADKPGRASPASVTW